MKNKIDKIIVWGTGKVGEVILSHTEDYRDICEIIAVIDSDSNKWGRKIFSFTIQSPSIIKNIEYDKIIISSSKYFHEIKEQIETQFGIEESRIENTFYFARNKLLLGYKDTKDNEIKEILNYIKDNQLEVFNYPLVQKYTNINVAIEYDEIAKLFYVWHEGKRLYMSRKYDIEEKVLAYYCGILLEQDEKSPHRYLDKDFQVNEGDIVVDVGVAEGNFSLEVVDKASRIYMVEADKDWIEALQYTFADYRDKIIMVPKFATDHTEGQMIALDDVIEEEVHFIKMDVEGEEVKALRGLAKIVDKSPKLQCAICAYHNDDDEIMIKIWAEQKNMKCCVTRGYMYFPSGDKQLYQAPVLRRGIVRIKKGIT